MAVDLGFYTDRLNNRVVAVQVLGGRKVSVILEGKYATITINESTDWFTTDSLADTLIGKTFEQAVNIVSRW